jgi:hypothetical protein
MVGSDQNDVLLALCQLTQRLRSDGILQGLFHQIHRSSLGSIVMEIGYQNALQTAFGDIQRQVFLTVREANFHMYSPHNIFQFISLNSDSITVISCPEMPKSYQLHYLMTNPLPQTAMKSTP